MQVLNGIGQALFMSFSMFWEILWPLILGFTLSAIIQSVVSHIAMAKTLGCDGPKCLTFATLYGIASSSCSYAAVALARSIFQKGASFVSAMAVHSSRVCWRHRNGDLYWTDFPFDPDSKTCTNGKGEC